MDYRSEFRVAPGKRVHLEQIDAGYKGGYKDRLAVEHIIDRNRQQLARLQLHLHVEHRRAVLICLQGMDASGKDGLVTHIIGCMNPLGCRVTAFRQPTSDELEHDFLWRIHKEVPGKGWVGVFNRSHYEAVLVERVRGIVPKNVWRKRYDQIREFERLLVENETIVIKFFLYISKEEQLSRFKARLDDPAKWWKISETDYEDRKLWDDYNTAYEDALTHCSTDDAPWYIIPSNHKWFRDLTASQIIVDTLEDLHITSPKPTVDIEAIRRKYHEARLGLQK